MKLLPFALFCLFGSAPHGVAQPSRGAVQNQESREMENFLRPYLDPNFNSPSGIDSNRPSIREYAQKIAEALPEKLSAAPDHPRKVLVLTYKTMGELHVPGAAGLLTLLREAEKKYGAFTLTEVYTSEGLDAKILSQFDAVVLNNISMNWNPADDALYNKLLPDYVRNGGGLFADHGVALMYLDRVDAEFNKMLGGCVWHSKFLQSEVHPQAVGGWNHCAPFAIKLLEPDNPLAAPFRGLPTKTMITSCQLNGDKRTEWPVVFSAPQELADELYAFNPKSNLDKSARVIVSVDQDKVPKGRFPPASNDFTYSLI